MLKLESRSLEVFEIETGLMSFLKDKGITASVHKFDNRFDIYISNYTSPEIRPESLATDLERRMRKFDLCKEIEIETKQTKYGFSIILGPDPQKVKLMEQKEDAFKCALCESDQNGRGHKLWPIDDDPLARCCDECNKEFIIPARNEVLKAKAITEDISKRDVEHAVSNKVLDDKFIWLFSVLDSDGEDIEDGIEFLHNAIDTLVSKQGTFLVAFPYVDPNPEDKSVDLVFADNPGPIIIYNREEATIEKPPVTRPTQEEQPKPEEDTEE